MATPDVRVDLERGVVIVDGRVLTARQAETLRGNLASALGVIMYGYSVEPQGQMISYRQARPVLPPEAPHCWRPGMRPIYDGGGG